MLLQCFAVIWGEEGGLGTCWYIEKASGEGHRGRFVKAFCAAVGKVGILSQEEPFVEGWPQKPHRSSQELGGVDRGNVQSA